MKLPALIIDVDGTIALHTEEERHHYDYSKVLNDRPNWPVIDMITRVLSCNNPRLPRLVPLVMSGRADENNGLVREHTEVWIRTFTDWGWDIGNLFMRPEFLVDDYGEIRAGHRDFRKDDIVKEELYDKFIEPYFNVVGAFDDRPRVLRMWQRRGIPTYAIGTPWIEF